MANEVSRKLEKTYIKLNLSLSKWFQQMKGFIFDSEKIEQIELASLVQAKKVNVRP